MFRSTTSLALMLCLTSCHPLLLCAWGGCGQYSSRDSNLTPLHQAAEAGDVTRAKQLIAAGASLDARPSWGWVPILSAAKEGHVDIVRLILDAGFDAKSPNAFGGTMLHAFAVYGTPESASVLIDRGAEVDARDGNGRSPLHWASYRSSAEML